MPPPRAPFSLAFKIPSAHPRPPFSQRVPLGGARNVKCDGNAVVHGLGEVSPVVVSFGSSARIMGYRQRGVTNAEATVMPPVRVWDGLNMAVGSNNWFPDGTSVAKGGTLTLGAGTTVDDAGIRVKDGGRLNLGEGNSSLVDQGKVHAPSGTVYAHGHVFDHQLG